MSEIPESGRDRLAAAEAAEIEAEDRVALLLQLGGQRVPAVLMTAAALLRSKLCRSMTTASFLPLALG